MKTVTSAQMRELDRLTIESGVPGETLMERAGTGAGESILEFISTLHPSHARRLVILAGKGNNGGDAYVVARFLSQKTSIPVKIFSTCGKDELSGDAKNNAGKLPGNISCEVCGDLKPSDFSDGDIIIDGLLGTGISGPLHQPFKQWIGTVNSLSYPVISLDIPSGLNGDDGSIANVAVKADLTIAIGMPKTGMFIAQGPASCGRLRLVDIGIPAQLIEKMSSDVNSIFEADVRKFLGRIDMNSHKGSRGHVFVLGGSWKYGGAPFLAGEAALRSGSGLVTVAVPESLPPTRHMLSLIVRKIPDKGTGFFSADPFPLISKLITASDSVVAGPGISDESSVRDLLQRLSAIEKPIVFDADALNIISKNPEIIVKRIYPSVLTPHPKEMKRLLKGFGLDKLIDSDRLSQAVALADKTHSTVVLKGHRTVVATRGRKPYINSSGSPALATAGSGDVLSGMIASFIAQGSSSFDASMCAVFIHGLAGEEGNYGTRGLTADDLPGIIPGTMKRISPFA